MRARVLLCGRPDLLTRPGGDTRQLLALRRCLGERAGLSLALAPRLGGHQLVHVFNLSRPLEPALQARHARARGLPVVCTAIYQDLEEYHRRGRRGAGRLLAALLDPGARVEDLRALSHLGRPGPRALARRPGLALALAGGAVLGTGLALALQRELLDASHVVVLGSDLEAARLRSRLPGTRREVVVPVGVDPAELARASGDEFRRRSGLDGFVLSVGRLEDLKNQLSLVEALRDDPAPLVLIGRANPLQPGYARALARAALARPRTLLLTGLPRPLVLSAMAAASVHVLPSWFETAGLASLEAAALGCAVVASDRGYARAFLGDDALYCDPADPGSILCAVREARRRGPSPPLRARVLERFTEAAAAEAQARVYAEVLG